MVPKPTIVTCWKCQKEIGEMPMKIGFRATCLHCGSDLHTCKSCKFYAPGKPNDCAVPGTDPIRDREMANFCEEYRLRQNGDEKPSLDRAKKIFGFDEKEVKKDFNSLFNDE